MLIFGGCVYTMGTTHESGTATLSWRYLIQGKACPNCIDTIHTLDLHLKDGPGHLEGERCPTYISLQPRGCGAASSTEGPRAQGAKG